MSIPAWINGMMRYAGVAAIGVVLVAGCASPKAQTPTEYQTMGSDPRRNADLARQENDRGVAMLEERKFSEAESAFKKALTADITFGPAHNNLGKCYYHQNKLYLAAWEFEYAIKLMPNQPEIKSNLGLVFESVGKLDQAAEQYSLALKEEPDNVQFVGNLARTKVRQGQKTQEVRDLLDKLVLQDTRQDWVEWAKERLALMGQVQENPATIESN